MEPDDPDHDDTDTDVVPPGYWDAAVARLRALPPCPPEASDDDSDMPYFEV